MFKVVLAACVISFSLFAIPVNAQSGGIQLEGAAGTNPTITTYTDSEGLKKAAKLTVAELTFPVRVFEETPTGMARIRHNGVEYWVASEDFRVRRSVQASCSLAMVRVNTGADRGANEGCVTAVKK